VRKEPAKQRWEGNGEEGGTHVELRGLSVAERIARSRVSDIAQTFELLVGLLLAQLHCVAHALHAGILRAGAALHRAWLLSRRHPPQCLFLFRCSEARKYDGCSEIKERNQERSKSNSQLNASCTPARAEEEEGLQMVLDPNFIVLSLLPLQFRVQISHKNVQDCPF
jgi:hypothetical protein